MRIRKLSRLLSFPLFFAAAFALTGCGGLFGPPNLNEPSSISLVPYTTSADVGDPVVLYAAISPALATGTVTFYNGSNQIGTATVSNLANPVAELSTTFSSPGTQTITAKYSGSQFYASSTSGPLTIGIYSNQLTTTTTTLQASNTNPQFDTNVVLTATVAPSTATGTVAFYNGATLLGSAGLNSGVATLNSSFSVGGAVSLKATYSGDYYNASSTSSPLAVNVIGPLVTSTNLQVTAPSVAEGGNVTLTAILTPSNATGSVTFYDGATAIGAANINAGSATLTSSFSLVGTQTLTAKFNANTNFVASTSNAVGLFVTGDTPATVAVQPSLSNPVIDDYVTLTASVTPSTATGSINFYDGTNLIGTGYMAGGAASFTASLMSSGPQAILAVYSGDTTYLSSSSTPITITVGNPGPNPSAVTLTVDNLSIFIGSYVTMTATVTPATATGQVTFNSNGVELGTAQVSNGSAAYSQAFLESGTYNITAVYNGDPNYAASTSSIAQLTVIDPND